MFIRVICITCRRREFEHLPIVCWAESGLFRWKFFHPYDHIDDNILQEAAYIIVDWSVDDLQTTRSFWTSICSNETIAAKVLHCSHDSSFRLYPPKSNATIVERRDLTKKVQTWVDNAKRSSRPAIDGWDQNPFLEEIDFLKEQMNLVIEKYFPEVIDGRVWVNSVLGGRSGTPIIRISVPDHPTHYVLKFFQNVQDFKDEWLAHEGALRWLGNAGIPLHPIPEVTKEAGAQAEAFHYQGSMYFPICYRWAHATRHLEELYQDKEFDFEKNAYQAVLQTLDRNQNTKDRTKDPRELPFVGPLIGDGRSFATCYQALISPTYRRWLRTACDEFRRKGKKFFGDEHKWNEGIASIKDTLDSAPPEWLKTPVEIRFGCIHGDPNSRNILFDAHAAEPSDPRFIDMGRFKTDAPLIVDLVFLESDIKFALLATEESRTDYSDWETQMLEKWRDVEDDAIRGGLDYTPSIMAEWDTSIAKAYTLISDIRRRAKEVSLRDPNGRAYFLYLLFWSLRQIRSWSIPPTKRLFALYSASRICQHLMKWPNK